MLTGADPVVVDPCQTQISLGITEVDYASTNRIQELIKIENTSKIKLTTQHGNYSFGFH